MIDIEEQVPVSFVTPDGARHERAPLLLISNNPYRYSGYPDFGRRVRLDTGKLGIGAVTNLPVDTDLKTVTLKHLQGMYEWTAVSYRVESDEPILAGVDGEAVTFESPLSMTIRHKQLRMLVPAGTQPGYARPIESVAATFLDLADTTGLLGRPESA
jgi:diacylglycerol kinase family enzyme